MRALVALLQRAFHQARAVDANAEIAGQRTAHGTAAKEALSYEIVVTAEDTPQTLAEKVLPKLVYFLDCRGLKLDAAGGGERSSGERGPPPPGKDSVFMSVFFGDSLYFIHASDFIAVVAPASGLTLPELVKKYGAASV